MGNKIKYLKPLALAGLVAASTTVSAGTSSITGTVKFTAGKNITVEQVEPLHYGENVQALVGNTCVIDIPNLAGANPFAYDGAKKIVVDYTRFDFYGQDAALTVNGNCGNSSGAKETVDSLQTSGNHDELKVGHFKITGASSSEIVLYFDVDNAGSNELSFEPTGYALSGDTAEALTGAAPVVAVKTFTTSNDLLANNEVTLLQAGGGVGGGTGRVEEIGESTGYANLFVVGNLTINQLPVSEDEVLTLDYTVNVLYK